jgi:uncharacterized membrane protein
MQLSAKSIFRRLEGTIMWLEVVVYLLVLLLIARALGKSVYDYFMDPDMKTWYEDTKLSFSYTISISLTSILFLEVLKLFYLKTKHQIFIVSGITILKLVINYFVDSDLRQLRESRQA